MFCWLGFRLSFRSWYLAKRLKSAKTGKAPNLKTYSKNKQLLWLKKRKRLTKFLKTHFSGFSIAIATRWCRFCVFLGFQEFSTSLGWDFLLSVFGLPGNHKAAELMNSYYLCTPWSSTYRSQSWQYSATTRFPSSTMQVWSAQSYSLSGPFTSF